LSVKLTTICFLKPFSLRITMTNKLGVALGVIILLADLYWTATSYHVLQWLVLGIIILVADLVWIAIDAKK